MSSSSKKSERQNDHFWARVCNLLLVDIHGSLLGTATYANDCIISILNLDMLNCMHCQSIVCQNSIARILYAKIPLLEFHMPIVLYAEIPIAKIQESRGLHCKFFHGKFYRFWLCNKSHYSPVIRWTMKGI